LLSFEGTVVPGNEDFVVVGIFYGKKHCQTYLIIFVYFFFTVQHDNTDKNVKLLEVDANVKNTVYRQ
jgi:hypothetical protein